MIEDDEHFNTAISIGHRYRDYLVLLRRLPVGFSTTESAQVVERMHDEEQIGHYAVAKWCIQMLGIGW